MTPSRREGARATPRRARDVEGDTARADDDRDRGERARGLELTANADQTPRAPLGTALAGVNATSSAREDDRDDERDDSADRDAEAQREADEVDAPPAGRARNSQTGRFGPPIRAPPLFAEDVGRLGKDDRRRVLARWSGRLRGLKKRALELSGQFPTSNVCVYFTKPFAAETREGMWCVRTRVVVVGGGDVALVFWSARLTFICFAHRAEEELLLAGPFRRRELETLDEGRLSGAQVIRRALGNAVGLRLFEDDRRRDALPDGVDSSRERAVTERAVVDAGALDELFVAIQEHVSAHSRGAVASAFAQSQIARYVAPVRGGEIDRAAATHEDARRRERDAAVAAALDDARRLLVPNSSE